MPPRVELVILPSSVRVAVSVFDRFIFHLLAADWCSGRRLLTAFRCNQSIRFIFGEYWRRGVRAPRRHDRSIAKAVPGPQSRGFHEDAWRSLGVGADAADEPARSALSLDFHLGSPL